MLSEPSSTFEFAELNQVRNLTQFRLNHPRALIVKGSGSPPPVGSQLTVCRSADCQTPECLIVTRNQHPQAGPRPLCVPVSGAPDPDRFRHHPAARAEQRSCSRIGSPPGHGRPGARHAGARRVRLHPLPRPVAHAPDVHHLRVSEPLG